MGDAIDNFATEERMTACCARDLEGPPEPTPDVLRRAKNRHDAAARRAREREDHARLVASLRKDREDAGTAQRAEAERKAEAERRRWQTQTLRVVNRGLLDVLVHNADPRARNWVAVVQVDPLAPSGLRRRWFERGRARGPARYIVPGLDRGSILEFAADHVAWSGARVPDRVYAVVLSVSEETIAVQPYKTFEDALGHQFARVAG